MALTRFFEASPLIQLHASAAIGATLTGALQMLRRKGGSAHRLIGLAFVLLMVVVAVSSFFIHTICQVGGFSAIHLLSVLTLITLPLAVISARRRKISRHRRGMIALYLFALLGAGLFTLLPGRLMYDVIFGTRLTSHACHTEIS